MHQIPKYKLIFFKIFKLYLSNFGETRIFQIISVYRFISQRNQFFKNKETEKIANENQELKKELEKNQVTIQKLIKVVKSHKKIDKLRYKAEKALMHPKFMRIIEGGNGNRTISCFSTHLKVCLTIQLFLIHSVIISFFPK